MGCVAFIGSDVSFQAKFNLIESEELAWVRKKKLDMSEDTRMRRAQAMGFDIGGDSYIDLLDNESVSHVDDGQSLTVKAVHGTAAAEDFSGFIFNDEDSHALSALGVYSSASRVANDFAGSNGRYREGARLIPVYQRFDKIHVIGAEDFQEMLDGSLSREERKSEIVSELEALISDADVDARVIDNGDSLFIDSYEAFDTTEEMQSLIDEFDEIIQSDSRDSHFVHGDQYGSEARDAVKAWRQDLIDQGYDGVLVVPDQDSAITWDELNSPNVISFYPEQIRSVHAAFDPEYSNSPNVLFSRNDSIAGAFDGNAVWMVADNIQQGEAWGVFLHEAGEHAGLETMLGAERYRDVVAHFDKLVKSGNVDAVRAVERVPADTPAVHVNSERLAYLIEDFTRQQTKTGKVKLFVQGLLSSIRAWAFATLPRWLTSGMQLSPADIQALAVRAARAWANGDAKLKGSSTSDSAPPSEGLGLSGENNPDIRYSKKSSSEARESGLSAAWDANLWAELQAQAPREGMARNKELLGKGWQWTKDHIQEVVKTGGLGLLTLRQLAEIGRDVVPAMQKYMALTERMLTERNQMADESGKLAQRWTKLDKATRQKLAFVMHKATLERVDPSLAQVPDPEILIRVNDLDWREKLGLARPASLLTEVEPERLAVNARTLKLLRKRYLEANNKALRSRGNRERFEQLQQVADSLLGDWKAAKAAVQQHERALPLFERLQQQFRALSPEAQAIYTESRDMYEARFSRKHKALIESINRSVMPDEKKKALARTLQQEFESAKLQGVYFPLHRQGAYFVRGDVKKEQVSETVYFKKAGFERINRGTGEVTQEANTWDSKEAALRSANSRSDLIGKDLIAVEQDGGWVLKENPNEPLFLMFPTAAEAEREAGRLQSDSRYSDVRMGKLNKQNTQDELGRAGVLMQTMTAMKANNQEVPDELYQLMLEMLPELSMRKNSIHRKGVQGFSADALNAFGHQMLHQAHQISKLEARDQLAQALSDIEEQAKLVPNEQRMLAGNLREEMKKRHDWVVNPKNAAWTNWTSSFGFVMYLGVSPAAALVNLSQVAIVGYPALAAKYGWIEAAKALNATARQLNLREVVLGDDAIARVALSADERVAMEHWHDMGVIDKSQAQMLAGVADNDALSNSPAYQRAMGKVAHLFHKAEVVNREVMLLSAYRLARAKGEAHEQAVQYASDVTWETQFDYSNANRAGFMQNDFAKVALMFKSYSQHMIYFLLRNARQWGKGGADAKAARSKLLGILAVTLAMGGVSALPLGFVGAATGFAYAQAKFGTKMASIGTVGAVAGLMLLSAAVLDDEEDWESELRKVLRSIGGEPLETLVFRGAVNLTTGVDLSSRISLDDLLMRDNDRELEGADAKGALLEQLAGPVVGYGVNALYTVPELWSQDHEWRAIEKLMPKFARDWMQTARFGTEGALTMKGSPIVERDFLGLPYSDELNVWNLFWKANGFNAEKLTGQYVANNDFMNAKKRVQASREKVLNRLFVASVENDQQAILEAKKAIKNWNQAHPKAKQINEAAMKRSLAARLRARRENDQGVRVQAAEAYLRE